MASSPSFVTLSRAHNGPSSRAKTISTRVTSEEFTKIEAAALREGKTLAEWLRELVLKEARKSVTNPVTLLLSEVVTNRHMLLDLFLATAQAHAEGRHLRAESVINICESVEADETVLDRHSLRKYLLARKIGDTSRTRP